VPGNGRVGGFQPLEISTPKVDFYTATTRARAGKGATTEHAERTFVQDIGNLWGGVFSHVSSFDDFTAGDHQPRYVLSLKDRLTGVQFGVGGTTETIRLDASGTVCDRLRGMVYADGSNALERVIKSGNQNATRLDLCADFNHPIPPYFIYEKSGTPRIKAGTMEYSETGWTYYVGSRGSDRFAKIYLYDEPHPRCNATRCEFQFRDTYANAARDEIEAGVTLETLYKRACNTFGISILQEMLETGDYGKFTASRAKTPDPDTLRWAWNTAFPALVRLVRDGDFNIEAFANAVREKANTQ